MYTSKGFLEATCRYKECTQVRVLEATRTGFCDCVVATLRVIIILITDVLKIVTCAKYDNRLR